jgi:hypothetical protein
MTQVVLTLAEFLLARLAEDEAGAQSSNALRVRFPHLGVNTIKGNYDGLTCTWQYTADRVLAECEAKRRIVERYAPRPDNRTDAELHRDHAHPAWEYATTQGQRKTWDDADVPPEGDGWIRNVEAGRDGWERFDYTEESYWRRPRAEPRQQRGSWDLRNIASVYADHPDYRQEWRS